MNWQTRYESDRRKIRRQHRKDTVIFIALVAGIVIIPILMIKAVDYFW